MFLLFRWTLLLGRKDRHARSHRRESKRDSSLRRPARSHEANAKQKAPARFARNDKLIRLRLTIEKKRERLGAFPAFRWWWFVFFDLVEFAGRAIPPWIAVALTASGSAVRSRTQL